MTQFPISPVVSIVDGHAVTTSQNVAAVFGKRHTHVIRAIRNLNCSADFNERNFGLVEYLDEKGERRPSYTITRDGCAFLVMGFTGPEAAKFKEAYIAEFNRMERAVKDSLTVGPQDSDIGRRLDRLERAVLRMVEHLTPLEPSIPPPPPLGKDEPLASLQEAAALIDIGPNILFGRLRDDLVLNRHGLPCLDYRKRGLFAVRLRGGYPRTCATQAGIDWLRQEYASGVRS